VLPARCWRRWETGVQMPRRGDPPCSDRLRLPAPSFHPLASSEDHPRELGRGPDCWGRDPASARVGVGSLLKAGRRRDLRGTLVGDEPYLWLSGWEGEAGPPTLPCLSSPWIWCLALGSCKVGPPRRRPEGEERPRERELRF
jgi:hypothetical protein